MHTTDNTYWHNYFDTATIIEAEQRIKTCHISVNGVRIHIDHYPQPDPHATTLIFNHGGGGYSRLLVSLALQLHAQGLRVVIPDQYGQGFSEGKRGDFRLQDCVQSIAAVAQWADDQFDGPLFMAGASIGNALTYAAAATTTVRIAGIVCHNLYDFSNPADALAVSRFAPLARIPGVPTLVQVQTQLLAKLLPRLHIPFGWLGNFRTMVDSPDIYPIWKYDPLPTRHVSMRYLASIFTLKPAIPLPDNTRPVLVINPAQDRMTHPRITKRNAERLGGPVSYVEVDSGHWSLRPAFITAWVNHVVGWIQFQVATTTDNHTIVAPQPSAAKET